MAPPSPRSLTAGGRGGAGLGALRPLPRGSPPRRGQQWYGPAVLCKHRVKGSRPLLKGPRTAGRGHRRVPSEGFRVTSPGVPQHLWGSGSSPAAGECSHPWGGSAHVWVAAGPRPLPCGTGAGRRLPGLWGSVQSSRVTSCPEGRAQPPLTPHTFPGLSAMGSHPQVVCLRGSPVPCPVSPPWRWHKTRIPHSSLFWPLSSSEGTETPLPPLFLSGLSGPSHPNPFCDFQGFFFLPQCLHQHHPLLSSLVPRT